MTKLRIVAPVGRSLGAGEVLVGAGALGVLGALGAARMAVIVSPSLSGQDYLSAVLQRVRRRSTVEILTLPPGEPVLDKLYETVAALSQFRPDWIVAVGGGGALDAAKICWALYEHPSMQQADLERPFSLPPLRSKARFLAAPTTNGSGSEASSSAIFQPMPGVRKRVLVSHELLPDVAVLDPKLALGLPPAVIASSGMDALAHAIEGFLSRYANPVTDGLAIGAAALLFRHLPRAVMYPGDIEVRTQVMAASYHAGCVQNVAVPGIGHAVAHQLAAFGIPHAVGTAIMLPAAMRWSSQCDAVQPRAEELARHFAHDKFEMFVKRIETLRNEANLSPVTPAVNWAALAADEGFVAGVLSDPCCRASARPVDAAAVRHVLGMMAQ